ncbi:MAG TPA: MFS transporter [Anaerolineae bacterium]|nr:MFS transporter [Anaerolineae bacterium]
MTSLTSNQSQSNVRLFIFLQSGWGIALELIAAWTIMVVFLQTLGATKTDIGLLTGLIQAGFYIPQLFSGYLSLKRPRQKTIVFLTHTYVIIPLILLAMLALRGQAGPAAVTSAILINLFLASGIGLLLPIQMNFIKKCLSPDNYAQSFGAIFSLQRLFGFIASLSILFLLTGLRQTGHIPITIFGYFFIIAAIILFLANLAILTVHEPTTAPPTKPPSHRHETRLAINAILNNRPILNFIICRWLTLFTLIGLSFAIAHGLETNVISTRDGIFMAPTLSFSTALFAYLFGQLAARRGFHLTIVLGTLFACLAMALTIVAPYRPVYYLVAFGLGASEGGRIIGQNNILMDAYPGTNKTTFLGVTNVLLGIVGITIPILGGRLINQFSYDLITLISLTIALFGAALMYYLFNYRPT